MKTINLIQGSPEWHRHRAAHFNASDAPAMLGVSKYKTRSQLLKEMATGITDDVDQATQRLFDDGHRFESLARKLAERLIGDDLSPVVGVSGKLSASFDGITFDETVIFEHKSLNDTLRGITSADDLPEQYRVQMEQQLLVSGATQCLFMASRWTDNDELAEPEMHVWYESDAKLRARIIAGWDQFAIDLANYQHVEAAPEVIAAPVQDLPALSIQVNGSISLISNLERFGKRLNEFVDSINKEPTDDQGFADAESAIKTLQNAQDALEAAEANALAQTADIDDMRKTVKLYADTARATRLMLEKMVKARKESIRIDIVQENKAAFGEHIRKLESELKPIFLEKCYMPDFAAAIKGKKTIASLREAAGTALRNGKMEADAMATDIRAKLAWYREYAAGYECLFADLQQIIVKPEDDFDLLVETRIANHKAAEAEKLEADRERIRKEEAEKLADKQQESTAAFPALQQVADVAQPSSPATAHTVASNSQRSAPTLRLGSINDRLGFNVTADFLSRMGFAPHSEGAAKLYHEEDFPLICRAIIQHISAVSANYAA